MAALVVNQIFIGIVSGLVLVILALGLALIFGHMKVVNFAHGAFYMLGAYVGVVVLNILGNFWATLFIVPIVMGAVGVVVERFLITRMYSRSEYDPLLLTFGLTFVIVELIRIVFGPVGVPFNIPPALLGARVFGEYLFPDYLLFVAAMSVLVIILLYFVLEKTDVGLIIRAGTQDNVMVRALGIDFDGTRTIVFAMGIALAGLAGLLYAPRSGVNPEMGQVIIILTFVVVVVGGMGSFWGAVASGLLIGVVQSLTMLAYSELAQIIVFVLMALVLLARPRGLFGTT